MDYINAKATYDATLSTMAATDDRYRFVDRMSKNLTEIANHLTTIAYQDSMLRISTLTEEERYDLAKKLQKPPSVPAQGTSGRPVNVKNAGDPKLAATFPGGRPPSRPTGGLSTQNSNFFAYDQREVRRGLREFEHEWGDRSLTDNWRVSAIAALNTEFDEITSPEDVPSDVLTDKDLERLFRDVPDTDEKRAAAHEAIQNAMLQLGSLYRDKLEDYQLSIDMLNDLLTKYPDTRFALDAYYQLYLSYLSIENFAQAEYYKNKIITEYASSKYAMVLLDPDYLNKQLTEEQRLDRDYQEVFQLVSTHAYAEARSRIDGAKSTFGTNHKLQAKYSILEAMCIGNLEGREAYVDALKAVIGNYPGTPEEIKARDMLLLMDEYQGSRLNLKTGPKAPEYKLAMDAQHFILVQVSGFNEADAQDVKVSISNYNRKYHSLDKLKISSLRFDTKGDRIIILVRSFKDGATAMRYLNGTKNAPGEFVSDDVDFEIFAVTQQNYREIVSQKSVDSYRPFFEENYQ
jgi:tetratricopeptide (TPR) repeat protein